MISENLEVTLHRAFDNARAGRQVLIGVENLLLELLDDPDARPVLLAVAANIVEMRKSLSAHIAVESPPLEGKDDVDTQPTLGFQRVVQRSIMHVQSMVGGDKTKLVTGANILVAIFGEKDSKAVEVLHEQGITRLDTVNFVVHGIKKEISNETAEETLTELASDLKSAWISMRGTNEKSPPVATTKGLRLFISYCHTDTECLDRLLVHLKPLERQGLIDCWSDKKIRAGDKWRAKLSENLEFAAVAILMVSADFLASDFIVNNELPPLLLKAEANGIRILPVILKPCGFHRDKILQSFQAVNDPKAPLLGLAPILQETLYDRVAEEVHREIESRRGRDL